MAGEPILVAAGNPGPMTGPGNSTWLLDGAEPTLIDAGIGASAHLDAIARHLRGRPLVRVLVTHGHPDHASGVPALRTRWPSIEACKWRRSGEAGEWRPLTAGERVPAGDASLIVLHTPGHARDHVCFYNEAASAVFSGDMLIAGTTVMIPGGGDGNLRDYLASLERLAAIDPARAYPGHGEVIERPVDLIHAYLEHRRHREAQVLACLLDGIVTVDGMLARIYPDLSPALHPAARATIQAHLDKLHEEAAGDPPG